MADFSPIMRRFTVLTGSTPDVYAAGVVFADGWAVYRKWLVDGGDDESGVWTTQISGSLGDLAYTYGAFADYELSYVDDDGPTISDVSPNEEEALQQIAINGLGFLSSTLHAYFGEDEATELTVTDEGTQISCLCPEGTGTVDVTVTTAEGTYTLADGFTYV